MLLVNPTSAAWDNACPLALADYGALDGLQIIFDFGYIITFKNPVADVLDLIPKCFCKLPPPNCSLASTIAMPLPLPELSKSSSLLV